MVVNTSTEQHASRVGFALDAVCQLWLGAEGGRVEVLLGDEPVVDAASTAADWARHEQVA